MISYLLAPLRFRPVFKQFLRREILGRYRGSMLGITWAFINPLLMLGVYTFVFVEVFKARWPGVEESGGLAFSQRIFAGLMVFNLFSEVVARAPILIVEQANLVKVGYHRVRPLQPEPVTHGLLEHPGGGCVLRWLRGVCG